MNPSSLRPDALVRHLRVWGFLRLEQNETAGLLSPPDTWAPVYSKCRGAGALRLTSAGLLQFHSDLPTLWFFTVPQLLWSFWKFLPWLQHPEVFSHIFATKCHSGEKCTESQALLTWSCPHLHCRAWQARLTHPKLKPGASGTEQNGLQIKQKPFKYCIDVCEQQGV